jgi:hypothetical protein
MKKFNALIDKILLETKLPEDSVIRSDGEVLWGKTRRLVAHRLNIKYPKNCTPRLKQIIDKLNELWDKLPTNMDSEEYQNSEEAKKYFEEFDKYDQLYAEETEGQVLEYDELPGIMKIPANATADLKKCIENYNKIINGMDEYKDHPNLVKQYKELADNYYTIITKLQTRLTADQLRKIRMSLPVTVTCYDKTETFPSAEAAIKHFEEGLTYCDPDSSEAERYYTIIDKLEAGKTIVTDDYWGD